MISGDTAPTSNIVENCDGCDVLIHEVYSQAKFEKRPEAWQRYHASFHTSSVELAEIAKKARPGLLILYHQLLWGATPEELLNEIRKIYDGKVKRIMDFGAFVEILPGTEGLLHISQIAEERIAKVTDVLKEGDELAVKVIEIDKTGRIRLSRKEALREQKAAKS